MTQKARDWDELERMIGVARTSNKAYTRRDVENLTRKRLKGPFWRRKR